MLLLLFLVLGIRVSWGQGGRHTGVARVRAVHGDKNILSVLSWALWVPHGDMDELWPSLAS